MTVKELKEILNNIEDDSQEVEVAIRQANKVYPVAYCEIHKPIWSRLQTNGTINRIEVSLPYDDDIMMVTSKRKVK